MEQLSTLLKQQYGFVNDVHDNMICNNTCTKDALNRDKANHVNNTCTNYETIPKRDYGLLLRKMESWGIVAPKAIVKKYGVFIVKRAVAYTEATPNVRNKAGYMTYMCQQFKKDTETNHVVQNEKPQSELVDPKEEKHINTPKNDLTPVKTDFGNRKKTILPDIQTWQEARNFLCTLTDYDMNDNNVVEFVNKVKLKYNFG